MPTASAPATALVLIDLQHGIVGLPLQPRSGIDVVTAAKRLAARFREAGALVIAVNVAFAPDFGDALRQTVDRPLPQPPGGLPADFSLLVDGLIEPGDLRVTKHQWGAFHGTDLDVQLRRRRITTVVIAGIATNMGVESTARQAHEHGYEVIVAEDATTSLSVEMHSFAIETLLPMISQVALHDQITLRDG